VEEDEKEEEEPDAFTSRLLADVLVSLIFALLAFEGQLL
jgi:hypothetical protein